MRIRKVPRRVVLLGKCLQEPALRPGFHHAGEGGEAVAGEIKDCEIGGDTRMQNLWIERRTKLIRRYKPLIEKSERYLSSSAAVEAETNVKAKLREREEFRRMIKAMKKTVDIPDATDFYSLLMSAFGRTVADIGRGYNCHRRLFLAATGLKLIPESDD